MVEIQGYARLVGDHCAGSQHTSRMTSHTVTFDYIRSGSCLSNLHGGNLLVHDFIILYLKMTLCAIKGCTNNSRKTKFVPEKKNNILDFRKTSQLLQSGVKSAKNKMISFSKKGYVRYISNVRASRRPGNNDYWNILQ
ncbi:PREDICTED: uncharacterized protein LOC105452231 isoform X1 [Wasmannia auropunctata]|uniref:uncharacterized protein LOC105452231 isoform X1 n=1 Tax=Wasmannia auropunctata TaxID=64793 RepID=UPI0005EFB73A|nr:PREDICTED: uncharacterized protein LOC105452231 isoform X1 [Wasmannia auropunctata]